MNHFPEKKIPSPSHLVIKIHIFKYITSIFLPSLSFFSTSPEGQPFQFHSGREEEKLLKKNRSMEATSHQPLHKTKDSFRPRSRLKGEIQEDAEKRGQQG